MTTNQSGDVAKRLGNEHSGLHGALVRRVRRGLLHRVLLRKTRDLPGLLGRKRWDDRRRLDDLRQACHLHRLLRELRGTRR